MPHTGLKHPLRLQLRIAVEEILTDIFGSIPYRDESWTGRQARNQEIIQRLKAGCTNGITGAVSVLVGQNATPAIGDPMFSLETVQTQYQVMPEVAKAIPFTAKFANRGERGGWGRAVAVPISFSDSTNGTALNHGATSSNGGGSLSAHPDRCR